MVVIELQSYMFMYIYTEPPPPNLKVSRYMSKVFIKYCLYVNTRNWY